MSPHRRLEPPRPLPLLALAFLMIALLPGCGKSGYPLPDDPSRNFSWKDIKAASAAACLAFTGSFEGEYRNFDGLRLEIAPLNSPEDCPGCPFVPQEVTELSPKDAGFNPKDGSVAFSYCPQQRGKAYRWRLAGISVFNRLPHATMVDRLLVVAP